MSYDDEHLERLIAQAGVIVPRPDSQQAIENAEELVLDVLFSTDDSHDVSGGVGKVKARLVIDLECSWPEPPYTNPEAVFETVKSYVLKALAAHKYLQFTGVQVRGQIDSEKK